MQVTSSRSKSSARRRSLYRRNLRKVKNPRGEGRTASAVRPRTVFPSQAREKTWARFFCATGFRQSQSLLRRKTCGVLSFRLTPSKKDAPCASFFGGEGEDHSSIFPRRLGKKLGQDFSARPVSVKAKASSAEKLAEFSPFASHRQKRTHHVRPFLAEKARIIQVFSLAGSGKNLGKLFLRDRFLSKPKPSPPKNLRSSLLSPHTVKKGRTRCVLFWRRRRGSNSRAGNPT